MKKHLIAGLALAVLAGTVVAANAVKSGPQVGEKLAGPFHPLNINGDKAGEKNCLYCSNGDNPVAMVFAREVTPALTTLVKKLDAATESNKKCDMGSFVVFCSDDKGLEKQLKELAKDAKLKHLVLSIDNQAGPEGYKVAKDADVTVVLYKKRTVKANYAFKKGELKDKDVDMILSNLSAITSEK